MIKLRLNRPEGPLVVFGLSHKNLEKLKEGKPIEVQLEQFGLTGTCLIYSGETEETMLADLVEHGFIERKAAEAVLSQSFPKKH